MPRATFRKQITSEELYSQINPKNIKLMERFLREKDTRSSDMTVKGYRSDLEIFLTWNLLHNENKFFCDIKKLEFSEFFSYVVSDLHWGSARFSRVRSVLSTLSQFIEKFFDDEYPAFRNVILKAVESMPKVPTREKTILSEEQVNGLLKHLVENNQKQGACWLALAIASGSRFSELLRFTTDILDRNATAFDGIFLETLKKIKTKGRTKQGKLLTKYIIKDIFLPYYDAWLIEREKILKEKEKYHTYIFVKQDGTPCEESTVRYWIGKFEDYLGVPFYPHCLRHFYTTYLAKIGLPHPLIKEIAGWESEGMVSLYDDVQAKDKSWKELENLKEHLNKTKIN